MLKTICPHYCPAPFCLVACPPSAIMVAVKGQNKNIRIDVDKCNRCGICRVMCVTYSRDKTLQRKLPWLSSAGD